MLQFIANICMVFCNLWEISYALFHVSHKILVASSSGYLYHCPIVREKWEWAVGKQECGHLAETERSSGQPGTTARPDRGLLGLWRWHYLISRGQRLKHVPCKVRRYIRCLWRPFLSLCSHMTGGPLREGRESGFKA